jgi:hypothetical protein
MYSLDAGGKVHANLLRKREGKMRTEVAAFAKMEDSTGTQLTASNTIIAFMR